MPDQLHNILSSNSNYAVRYFTLKYNKIPQSRAFYLELNLDVFISKLKERYPMLVTLVHNQSFQVARSKSKWELREEGLFCELKEELVLYYDNACCVVCKGDGIKTEEVDAIGQMLLENEQTPKEDNRKFSMIKKPDYGDYEMAHFNIKELNLNIADNYNEDLVQLNASLIEFFNSTDETGIVLFHGQPGAGKTSYIRYLIASCENRFIYIPNNLVQYISQPDFISFISSYPNSILILEDCEELIKPRDQAHEETGIATLLSLGDGLLGDALKLKIICTFNCELKKIDKALLRKGRLKFRYEFDKLSIEKTNRLFKSLKLEVTSKVPLTVAEIYNYQYANNAIQEEKLIGFSSGPGLN